MEKSDVIATLNELHRAWTDIKSSITGTDDQAMLAECERGEDTAESAYEAALKKDLPAEVRTALIKRGRFPKFPIETDSRR